MSEVETSVSRHYEIDGLLDRIVSAIGGVAAGGALDPAALEPVDEFHLGGAPATARLLPHLGLGPGSRALDLGSGVGGPARYVALKTGAHVTGIDLTEDHVRIATELSRLTGLAGQTVFRAGSALDLPFAAGAFDAAMMLHVGMNIPDKARLMAQVARTLRKGGVFAVYDVMRVGPGEPAFPLPWASAPDHSFTEPLEAYRSAAAAAGLTDIATTLRRDEAMAFLRDTRERVAATKAAGLPPPPGVNLVMGDDAQTKIANLAAAVMAGTLAPVELILRKG